MNTIFAVAAGGALGAVARYWMMGRVGHAFGIEFPWATLAVNVLGSAVLGILAGLMAFMWSPSPELRAFLVVGVLGAMTTFSTFSLDVVLLIERGDWGPAALYIVVSVLLSVGALMAGLAAVRGLAV